MADYDIPDDLVELQRAFFAASDRCERVGDALPSSIAIAEGEPVDFTELEAAREERSKIAEDLRNHPWWETAGNRYEAWKALLAAARSAG